MKEHMTVHPAHNSIRPIHIVAPAVRALVSPPVATQPPSITVYFRDVDALKAGYACLQPYLNDMAEATLKAEAPQPNLRYSLAVLAGTNEHLSLLAQMGISRIALPFIGDSINKAITRSRIASDSRALGQLIISNLEAPQQSH
jgi:hypothetical protein